MTANNADEFRITVNLVCEATDAIGDESWILEFPAGPMDRNAVRDGIRAALGDGAQRPPFTLTDTERVFSWGAFNTTEAIVLTVATGFVSDTIRDAFAALFKAVRRDILEARRRPPVEMGPMDRVEAEQRARWYVAQHYELGIDVADELRLTSEEERPVESGWLFVFEHEKVEYAVELRDADGLSAFVRVRRHTM